MAENKGMETMLAQTSREEVNEIQALMDMLDPYEKREFIGIMRGAKVVKAFKVKNNTKQNTLTKKSKKNEKI